MTSLLRRKRPITAQITRRRATGTERRGRELRSALIAAIVVAVPSAVTSQVFGQSWQPTRVASTSSARPLEQSATAVPSSSSSASIPAAASETEQLGSGVVLRWTKTSPRAADSANVSGVTAENAFASSSPAVSGGGAMSAATAFEQHESSPQRTQRTAVVAAQGSVNNPLRTTGRVRQAAYQQQPNDVYQDPFGDSPPPTLPGTLPNDVPQLPGNNLPPTSGLPDFQDPLAAPEMAPDPSALQLQPPNPFERGNGLTEDRSPRDLTAPEEIKPSPKDSQGADDEELDELDDLATRRSSRASCNAQRDRLRNLPITNIDLDVSPGYGEGLRSVKRDMEKERLDFAAGAEIRDWSDYRGQVVATGRLIDLRDDRVVLDVNGTERSIPFRDLSDVDVAYVGKSWNIPQQCGIGYEQFIGRNFIPSTVQWQASGACHKPLYFEQVQLERYGHEAGPVLQPLVSTVHFFGNIAVLPYKMGIHPPQECQYSLGYFRPGNCAPYMMQPIPWSLRGALMQAGAVTGGAALIP